MRPKFALLRLVGELFHWDQLKALNVSTRASMRGRPETERPHQREVDDAAARAVDPVALHVAEGAERRLRERRGIQVVVSACLSPYGLSSIWFGALAGDAGARRSPVGDGECRPE